MQLTPLKPSLIHRELQLAQKHMNKQHASIDSVFEAWNAYPHRFFFFNHKGQTYCGQKLISALMLELGCPVLFCSHIKAEMILGALLRVQTSETGVEVYYENITVQNRFILFDELMNNRMIDLYFPYVPLTKNDRKEYTSSSTGWRVDSKIADFLLKTEFSQRKISAQLIKADDKPSPIIYDPACSTGDFLYHIKTEIPDATLIGQDLSQEMCIQARQKIDQISHGNALSPCVPTDYCDYIFFRFLNVHVVSCDQAKVLFKAIIPCLKQGGKAILFGFTPVLIPLPFLMQQGFKILSCNAAEAEENTLIQYYVIQKLAKTMENKFNRKTQSRMT